MSSPIKVLVLSPVPSDTTSFYRALGPLGRMANKKQVQLQFVSEVNWSTVIACDLVFMQRPFTDAHKKMFDIVKNCRKPVVLDYDDFLFDVPRWNPVHKKYSNKQVMKNMAEMIAGADHVFVSTFHLKELIFQLNPHITVIPNAYDFDLFGAYPRVWEGEWKKIITWRGSPTHERDVAEYTQAIVSCKKEEWLFSFMGHDFYWLQDLLKSAYVHTNAIDPIEYFDAIHKVHPRAFIVPLFDCDFNRAKSNIAWIEATHAGAVTLAPDWPEWKRHGVVNYESPQDFEKKLKQIMLMPEAELEQRVFESFDDVKKNFNLKDQNERRLATFHEVVSRKY